MGSMAPHGIGGILAVPAGRMTPEIEGFLEGRRRVRATLVPTNRVAIQSVGAAAAKSIRALPPGMHEIAAGKHALITKFRQRECGERGYAPVGGPHALHADFDEQREVNLPRFALMRRGVTNAEYVDFLEVAGYYPKRDENFLKHFEQQHPKAGEENLPVKYVNLEDARAYLRTGRAGGYPRIPSGK